MDSTLDGNVLLPMILRFPLIYVLTVFRSCLGGLREEASMPTQQKRRSLLIMNWKLSFLARWESLCWANGRSVRKCKLS